MISDLLQCCVFRLNLRKDYPFRWEFSPAIEQPVPSTPVSARALQNGSPVPAIQDRVLGSSNSGLQEESPH